jgi:hypothetical protein
VPLLLFGPPFFPNILFWVHQPLNWDDRHLLANAMASGFSDAWQFLSKRTIGFCWAKLNHRTLMSTPPPKLEMIVSARARIYRNRNCKFFMHIFLQFNNFQASLNHRANACSCLLRINRIHDFHFIRFQTTLDKLARSTQSVLRHCRPPKSGKVYLNSSDQMSLWKNRPFVRPSRGTNSPKLGLLLWFSTILHKENNCPIGEKSPNLVPLIYTKPDFWVAFCSTIPYNT